MAQSPRPGTAPADAPRWRDLLAWLLAPTFVGAVLRVISLPSQILAGDELHAVRALLTHSPGEILSRFGMGDYCLPLTALARWHSDLGLRVSEVTLRAPSLVAGVTMVPLLSLAAQRLYGRETARWLAWLLAVSPWLVLYSRIARSYAPAILFSSIAVFSLADRSAQRRSARLAAWTVAGAAAVWFFPLALPFVIAPAVYLLGAVLVDPAPGARAERPRLFLALASFGALCGILFAPALRSFLEVLQEKGGRGAVSSGGMAEASSLLLGARFPVLAVALLALALVGGVVAHRRVPAASRTLFVAASGQLAAVLLVRPFGLAHPVVLARYLLPALPVLLLAVATLVAAIEEAQSTPPRKLLARSVAGALIATFVISGPLPAALRPPAPFAVHNSALWFSRSPARWPAEEVPAVYVSPLVDGSESLVEGPFPARWDSTRFVMAAQRFHGKRVVLATPEAVFDPVRTRFRTLLPMRPEEILRSGADVFVLHLDPVEEETGVASSLGLEVRPRKLSALREAQERARRFRALVDEVWGPPDFSDDRHLAWDLRRIRVVRPATFPGAPPRPARSVR